MTTTTKTPFYYESRSSSGSVQRSSRVRQHVGVTSTTSSSVKDESSSSSSSSSMLSSSFTAMNQQHHHHHHNNNNNSTILSESSPSKDKKNQPSSCYPSCLFCRCCCSLKQSSSSSVSGARRRQPQQQRVSPSMVKLLLLPPKWRQRSLLYSMGLLTFVLGWRIMLLHEELLLAHQQQQQQQQQYDEHYNDHPHLQHPQQQQRLLEMFVRQHGPSNPDWLPHLRTRRRQQPQQPQQQQQRQRRRQQRTRPPPLDPHTAHQFSQPPDYQLYEDDDDNDIDIDSSDNNMSQSPPLPSSFALNANTSRVVLVGMVTSSWGISLALHLQQHYGISNILGVDDFMYPNVQQHQQPQQQQQLQQAYRMALTNRYEYVARHLPLATLWTPPPPTTTTSSSSKSSSSTLLAQKLLEFQPTHIVYLSPTVSLDRVLQSYHHHHHDDDDEGGGTTTAALPWNETARLFDMHHRVQSLQQVLQAIQEVYHNNTINSRRDSTSGQQTAPATITPNKPRILIASPASSCSLLPQHYQLDQVLFNTYLKQQQRRHGIAATHVLVPPLYGTWLDDHDPLHEWMGDVLRQSVFPQNENSKTNNTTTTEDAMGKFTKRHFPPPYVPHYLHVQDLLQVVTKLLEQPAASPPHDRNSNKMLILPPDTTWSSLRHDIRDIILSGSDNHEHAIFSSPASGDGGGGDDDFSKHRHSSNLSSSSSEVQKQRVRDMLAWKYVHDYPWRDPATHVFNNDSHWIANKQLPVEEQLPVHAHLPCACECSFLSNCAKVPTAFDQSIVLASHQATDEAKFVVYTVNWETTLTSLAPIPLSDNSTILGRNPALDAMLAFITAMTSRIAFISDQSPLALRYIGNASFFNTTDAWNATRNGQMEEKGWTLVWLNHSRLTMADRLLPKIAPGRLFSVNINKAMYVAYHKIDRAPILPALTYLMDHMVDRKPQRGRSRAVSLTSNKSGSASQSVRYVFQPPSPARRAVLFAQEHPLTTPSASLRKVARQLWWSFNSTAQGQVRYRRYRQVNFYERAMRLMMMRSTDKKQSKRRRVAFQWVDTAILVHNIHLTAGRNFRCDWYGEHLKWRDDNVGNDDDLQSGQPSSSSNQTLLLSQQREGMEELSLAYLITKHRMEGRLGKPLVGDESWCPYFDLTATRHQLGFEPPRQVNGAGQEIFLRILSRPMGEAPPAAPKEDGGDEDDEN